MDWRRFEACFARLDRAHEHHDEFGAEWPRYLDEFPAELKYEVDDRGRGRVLGIRHQQ
jgi:hypothetical protein